MIFFIADPLEQFSIECFPSYLNIILNYLLAFNSSSFFNNFWNIFFIMLIPITSLEYIYGINVIWLFFLLKSVKHVLNKTIIETLLNSLFKFVDATIKQTISVKKYFFLIFFFIILLFIFINNIIGMFPYSLTITSHLIITLYFSIGIFLSLNMIGLLFHKEKFFVLFLPEGVPVLIIPFLIIIEYVSYISRVFSLAIRLFANMLAGHILLKILISFVWILVSLNAFYWILNIIPGLIIFVVFFLEIIIAFLQAYVFFVLITIYLKDVIHTH